MKPIIWILAITCTILIILTWLFFYSFTALDHYLSAIREMNKAYVKGDMHGVEVQAKIADKYYRICITNGDMVHLGFKESDEKVFLDIINRENVRYYLSGSQFLGGQHAARTYSLEKSDYQLLMKQSKDFISLISRNP